MGFKDTKWAYTLDLTATECAVLVAVCTMTDDKTHDTYASQDTLARMSKLTRPTVNKALGALEDRGILIRTKRSDANGQRIASLLTANVGNANIGAANVGETQAQCNPGAEPTSATPTATSINQIDQPEGQPDLLPEETFAESAVVLFTTAERTLEDYFAEAWADWPKKVDRKDALAKFKIACRAQDPDNLVVTIKAHGEAHAAFTERQFVPGLAVWLNKERWNNPLPEAPQASRQQPTRNERNLGVVQRLAALDNAPKGISA